MPIHRIARRNWRVLGLSAWLDRRGRPQDAEPGELPRADPSKLRD